MPSLTVGLLKNGAARVDCCRPARFVTIRSAMRRFDPRLANFRRPQREGKLVTVGRVGDVPEGRGATVELDGGKELALYNVGGEFFCVENFCPHKGAPLADGTLCGHTVECDWHGWRFDVRSGSCLNRPDEAVETYEVVIEDGWIKIRV
jgi:nitrite reductase (NADH) small subunit